MTIPPEAERGYGKPVEEVARAICCPEGCEGRTGSGQPCDIRGEDRTAIEQAKAVLKVLRSKGWLSDLGITAIEAERMEK